jgi:uncharacterized membrane protein YphA (DoxX/SURF4 family)
VVEGCAYLLNPSALTPAASVGGLLTVAGGLSLILGFLTPVTAGIVSVVFAGVALSWVPVPGPALNVLDSPFAAVFVVVVAIASALIGPGAFSFDSYLFGRREIFIPHDPVA